MQKRKPLTVGVVGSRRRNTTKTMRAVRHAFRRLWEQHRVVAVVSGGCRAGADRIAPDLACEFGLTCLIHFPNYRRYGRAATFVRNTAIALSAHYLIAAPHADRTGGTEDTIRKFLKRKPRKCLILI
jgi:hypothetical protein